MSSPVLLLSASHRRELVRAARTARPREACGLLFGHAASACSGTRVTRVLQLSNSSPDPRRFELDPAAVVAAHGRADELGLDLLGAWHSHPDLPAQLSPADLAQLWPGWIALVVSTLPGEPLRAVRRDKGGCVALRILPASGELDSETVRLERRAARS